MKARLIALGRHPLLIPALVVLNILAVVGMFIAYREPHGGDLYTYQALADGLLHGEYSMWWQLPVDVPDTLRNPGYPVFLAAFRIFTMSLLPVQIAQALLYCLSVFWTVKLIQRLGGSRAAVAVFLLLLLPSINIAFYNTSLFAETLTLFLVTAFMHVATTGPLGPGRAVLMGLLLGAAFQCRSPLLYLPFVWAAVVWLSDRRRAVLAPLAVFLLTFVATTVPYGMWNLRNHGVYSVTPIEGGAGVLHFGWWTGRIPGHTENWYWGNFASVEMVDFVPPERVPAEVEAFNAEWRTIDSAVAPLMNATDTLMLAAREENRNLFKSFNSRYTLERERLLKEATVRNVKEEPGYTFLHSAYTAVRMWVTGVQLDKFHGASMMGKVSQLYPFLLTLVMFLLAIVLVPWALFREKGLWKKWLTPLLLCVYFGLIHIPAHIQSRYTIPVRMLLMALIALALVQWLKRRKNRVHSEQA